MALRFERRREGGGVLASVVVVSVVVTEVEVEASGTVVADLEKEASGRAATAALDELAVVMCRVKVFRTFFAAIAAFVASVDGVAVLARARTAGGPALVRAFLVANPPVTSPAARRFGAIEATFVDFLGFSRRTRLDCSTTRFALGARLRGARAIEVSVASCVVWKDRSSSTKGRGRGRGRREVEVGFGSPASLSTLAERKEISSATGDWDSDLGGGMKMISCSSYVCVSFPLFLFER